MRPDVDAWVKAGGGYRCKLTTISECHGFTNSFFESFWIQYHKNQHKIEYKFVTNFLLFWYLW